MSSCTNCGEGRVSRQCANCGKPLHKHCALKLSARPTVAPGEKPGKWAHWHVCEGCALRILERATGVSA